LLRVDTSIPACVQVVVLAHTRELAEQIATVYKEIAKYTDIEVGLVKSEDKRPKLGHVVITTPKRLISLLTGKKKMIHIDFLKCFVIDEADNLFLNFQEEIKDTFKHIPPTCQILLFSATFPETLMDVLKSYISEA
jgi:superfamily II DNA/RNA helicase